MKMRTSLAVSTLALILVLAAVAVVPLMAQDWPMFGQNVANTASTTQTDISTKNVYKLMPKWAFTTAGDVSARAAVVNGVAYFPDWAGNLYAVNTTNGKLVWSHQFSDYSLKVGTTTTPLKAGTVSRNTPTISNGVLYIGTQFTNDGASAGVLLAINASDGTLKWATQPVPYGQYTNPFPVITAAPTVANGTVYVGMTSWEEAAAGYVPGYPCCFLRGSVVALDAATGATKWQVPMAPPGYSGANVWGSNPVVDTARNTLYVSTGDNYNHPAPNAPSAIAGETFSDCLADTVKGGSEPACLAPDDYVDAIVALDLTSGAVKWAKRFLYWNQSYALDGSDDYNGGCFVVPKVSTCPTPPLGPDYDFGSGANEITYTDSKGKAHTILGAGQKSGIYFALNPDTGDTLWQTQVGPGSALGGMEWGSASDGQRIYVAIANFYGLPSAAGSAGSWSALDPASGKILWQTADPNGAIDLGPVTVANGVVYTGSMGAPSFVGGTGSTTSPTMFALDAASGKVLWKFAAGSSVISGAAIVQDTVFWGAGYAHLPLPGFSGVGIDGLVNNKLYAFTPNGT
jgi:polyvinyl alcohol dehydrogenase (cytochrome)